VTATALFGRDINPPGSRFIPDVVALLANAVKVY
jgi:hypothetical protein